MNRYPYTDMHEMNLDWILLKVKEMIGEWDTTKNAWNELHEFVDTYFENLDVQQEINNKLDEMFTDGELWDLMKPYIDEKLPQEVADQIADVVALQIGSVVADQLPLVVATQLPAIAADAAATEVGTWLAAHIDPDTGYVIDDTLTTENAAADAKATGDAIGSLNTALGPFYHTQTGTLRSFDLSISTSQGDLIVWNPVYFSALTPPTGYVLYGYDGENYVVLDNAEGAGFRFVKSDASYASLRIGITTDPLADDETLTVICSNLSTQDGTVNMLINGAWKEALPDNLVQGVSFTKGYVIGDNGIVTTNATFKYSDFIELEPNAAYVLIFKANGNITPRSRIHGYDSDGNWVAMMAVNSDTYYGDVRLTILPAMTRNSITKIRVTYSMYLDNVALYKLQDGQPYVKKLTDVKDYQNEALRSYALKGKKLSILGASISTFDGYIPAGYSEYYPHVSADANAVVNVHDTYWQKVLDATGMTLLVNNSSAGSFCTTGHGSDSMAGCGDRCEGLDDGTNEPDVIVIQLGGNDFTRSTDLGTYDGTQAFPETTTTFREAYAIMLKKILTKYEKAKVFCGTIPIMKGGTYVSETFPATNGDGVQIEEFNKAIRELANLFGCSVAEFSKCGLTFFNVSDFMQDASGSYGQHPNSYGHSMMANELLKALGQEFGFLYSNK